VRTIQKRIFKNRVRIYEPDSCESGWSPLVGPCDNGNESSGSIKAREDLDEMIFS
jgi:hypothetical protein